MLSRDLSRCSVASEARGDQLAGTAPVARRWLLLEHPGPWDKKPLDTAPLTGDLGRRMERECADHDAKILLVRRQGRRIDAEVHQWWAVDTVTGAWVRGTWRTSADLLDAAAAIGERLDASTEPAEPMVLVCTHATRDACCAVRGRPISARLAKVWPEEVWECTHLGGHRFAGTMLSLPSGAVYGRLDPQIAHDVIVGERAGRVVAARLRGLSRYTPAVQAAQATFLAQYGPAALADVSVGRVEVISPTEDEVEVCGVGALPTGTVYRVRREELTPAPLSCGATEGEHAAYRVQAGTPAP